MHINSPHGPLCIDSTGKPDYTYVTGPGNYLAQLVYTQKSVLSLIREIQKVEKDNCIILVQSDHGIRAHSTPVVVPEKKDMFRVVNAVYFPDSSQRKYFTDSMNVVNNFRMIFNYQFNTRFGKLP